MKPFSPAFTTACAFGLVAAVHLPDSPEPVPEGVLNQLPEAEREHALTLGGYRQVSFVGGRLALHRAVRVMGRRSGPVLPGHGGMPQLPEGVAGSITHKRTLAVALAARECHGALGVDLEDLHPPRMGVAPRVLRPEELAAVEALPEHRRWTGVVLRFSLKEALYKALYPYVQRYVDFMEASVMPDTDCQAAITLHLEQGEGPFLVEARFQWLDNQVLSTVRVQLAEAQREAC
ncbi:MAG: 4'-phosphopantetheinyl transferase superfamily protein [Alphaproteobacteria bacterium]|nr:4'-phosphopantetheinyl transferase superfamily protein [Alphaproteobacteria bacterium]MCB9794930.1 4'-phosphopantetheinyl transferase superfamily protein [Alphaproteobacteria bacterium]